MDAASGGGSDSWFWRAYAAIYDAIWDSPLTDAIADSVVRLTVPNKAPGPRLTTGPLVVELGCGTGLITRALAAAGCNVVGVDSSEAMLAQARRACRAERTWGRAAAICADAAATPLPDSCADAVVAVNVLQFVPRPETVVAEALRLVAPNGVVVFAWPIDGLTQVQLRRAEALAGMPLVARWRSGALRRLVAAAAPATLRVRPKDLMALFDPAQPRREAGSVGSATEPARHCLRAVIGGHTQLVALVPAG